MYSDFRLIFSTFAVAGWIITGASSGRAQSSPANPAAPASTISSDANPGTNQIQDVRALAQKAEQIRAACVNGRRRICGQVLQVTPGGLVVDSGYTDLLRPELSRSWVAPNTVTTSRPANLVEENAPGSPCIGLVFLADIPKRPAVKIYDYVIIEAYPAGQFTYQPVPNVTKTIRKFSARLEGAVQLNLDAGKK